MTTGISMVVAVHPQLAADVEAVDVREHQVQEQHVGLVFPGQPQAGLAVLGDDRLEFAHPEDPGHESRLLRMVFHDQSRCHRWILRCTSPGLDPRASVPVAGRGAGPSVPGGLMVSGDMQLDDVGILQLVVPLDGLAVEDARAPDPGGFQ